MEWWVDVAEEVPYFVYMLVHALKEGEKEVEDEPCPTMTPQISSFGIVPCRTSEKAIRTHGKYGAVKTSRPRKLRRVSGLRRLQI